MDLININKTKAVIPIKTDLQEEMNIKLKKQHREQHLITHDLNYKHFLPLTNLIIVKHLKVNSLHQNMKL